MFQQFYQDNLISSFIKNILSSTPLPLFDTVRRGDYIIKNNYYIYDNYIIYCSRSGYIEGKEETAEFSWMDLFTFGQSYKGITETFKSNISYYDELTHKYLGEYLRAIRDIYEINLMPLYNCSAYKTVEDFWFHYIYKDDNYSTLLVSDNTIVNNDTIVGGTKLRDTISVTLENSQINDKYKMVLIPIKYNRTYSIFLDSSTPIIYKPVIYSDSGLTRGIGNTLLSNSLDINPSGVPNFYIKPFTGFNKPFTYKLDLKGDSELTYKLQQHEDDLYLAIQMYVDNDSSLVVIEGEYENPQLVWNFENEISCIDKLGNKSTIKPMSTYRDLPFELKDQLFSKSSLTIINNKKQYAFCDRLIEFLLLNVINSDESIPKNTGYFEELLNMKRTNIWNDYIRIRAYFRYMNTKNNFGNKNDITGFLDKDLEKYFNSKVPQVIKPLTKIDSII